MNNKFVYIGLTADSIHHGHINLIENAKKYGEIIIGLLTDKAVSDYKRLPLLSYEQRKKILMNIKGVNKVVAQNEWDYSLNIKKYKPKYMIHGNDWLVGPMSNVRQNVIKELKKFGGKLIEIPYTKGISSTALSNEQNKKFTTPELRLKNLKRLLEVKNFIRIIETHSPISALIAENLILKTKNRTKEFDGFWSSSLTDSSRMGKPDIEFLNLSERLSNINNIFDVTSKPLIMDIDTGGKIEHLKLNIRSMERLGISAVIMEDKTGLKKNSLNENTSNQKQETIKNFCEKIHQINKSKLNDEFMVIARIESFILGKGLKDAILRAKKYVEAGANGIMIHSKSKKPKEIFEFAKLFRKYNKSLPLVCVPSTYNTVKEKKLIEEKFNIVIYANHLFRAAYPAMQSTAKSILINGRSKEIDKKLISINNILKLIPGTS
jgi:phosphoenolpyruvate phosphomutase / 2-hydroxyethylphosphonate cytidylyltransferase